MLRFYSSLNEEDLLRMNNEGNSFSFTFDGRFGGAQVRRIFVKNDDPNRIYRNIQLQPVDKKSRGYTSGTSWSWKMLVSDASPTDSIWDNTTAGAAVNLDSLEDASTMVSVWVRVEIPGHTPAQVIEDIVITVSATEILNA